MSGRRPVADGHGLSPAEEAIVVRLEAGESPASVARSLGLRRSTVAITGRRYIIGDTQLNAFERQCRAGEARYRAALAATGKAYA